MNLGEDEADKDLKEFLESLPAEHRKCFEAVRALQLVYEGLSARYRAEDRGLERMREQKTSSIYAARREIVTPGLPGFWLRAMKNCGTIRDNITERDEVVLKHLVDITTQTLAEEEGVGFRLRFHFAPNDFFTNEVLTKVYFMTDVEYLLVERAEGTQIDWKEGRNLTVRTVRKKQRNKSSNDTRVVVKSEPCESFFNFFSPPTLRESDHDDEFAQREDELDADQEVGQCFHDDIVPHAVGWFTGEEIPDSSSEESDLSVESSFASDDSSHSTGSGSDSMEEKGELGEEDEEDDSDWSKSDKSEASSHDPRRKADDFVQGLPEPQQQCVAALKELDQQVSHTPPIYWVWDGGMMSA